MVGIVGFFGEHTADSVSSMIHRMSYAVAHRGQEHLVISNPGLHQEFAVAVHSPTTLDHYVETTTERTLIVCCWGTRSGTVKQAGEDALSLLDIGGASENEDLVDALVLCIDRTGLTMMRTPHFMSPMYYQWAGKHIVFSTERKALWSINHRDAIELQPGQTVRVKPDDIQPLVTSQDRRYPNVVKSRSRRETLTLLLNSLEKSFEPLRAAENVGVLFSGGVDSSLAAVIAQRVCGQVTLFTACSKGSRDCETTPPAAQALDMKLNTTSFDANTVWEMLPELIYATETSRRQDIEITLPFFIAARAARNAGIPILVSGQGPDELFAGYARHVKVFEENGEESLDSQLRSEIADTHRTNIERDERAIAYNGLSAFFPYLGSHFIFEALAVPSRWKVSPGMTPNRKVIFRELAIKMGLPEEIALAPKKATQYSSGSKGVLTKAVSQNVCVIPNGDKTKRSALIQIALDRIALEMGLPVQTASDVKLDIDLRAAHRSAQKIRTINRQ